MHLKKKKKKKKGGNGLIETLSLGKFYATESLQRKKKDGMNLVN